MESRIARLDLRATARADVLDRARLAEPFARRVLARCDELLEQRLPGRCIVMRRLDTRWRLRADRLDAAEEVDAVAEALADGIAEELEAAPPHGSDNVVAFADEVAYRAAYLEAVAAGRAGAWFFHPLVEEGSPPVALARSTAPRLAQSVLIRLAERDALIAVLGALDTEALKALALAIGAATLEPALAPAAQDDDVSVPEALRSLELAAPSLPPAARRIVCLIEARRAQPEADEADIHAFAQRMLACSMPPAAAWPARDRAQDGTPSAQRRTSRDAAAAVTQLGGLFYLLNPALELAIGESVWKACLAENVFFTRVAWTLAGPDAIDDAGPLLFGGASHDHALGPLDTDRLEELTQEILHALVEALPRCALAELPPVGLFVLDRGGGRLLAAAPARAPFPIFAWPAQSALGIEEGIRRFLAGWPPGALVTAHPALAEADRSGRLHPDFRAPLARPLLLADAQDHVCAAALTQAAGSLAYLFAARAGAHGLGSPAALVERYLAVPATIVCADEEMTVHMPADRIDVSLRRAGLDRDPGWVPWLRAHVRFAYDDLCEPE